LDVDASECGCVWLNNWGDREESSVCINRRGINSTAVTNFAEGIKAMPRILRAKKKSARQNLLLLGIGNICLFVFVFVFVFYFSSDLCATCHFGMGRMSRRYG
jgi:hypothetical protein